MNINTDNSTDQRAWQHSGMLAVNFCGIDWIPLLDRLAALDDDRIGQLTEAAARLREADRAAAESIGVCRASVERFGAVNDEYRIHLEDSEAMLAVHGYLPPLPRSAPRHRRAPGAGGPPQRPERPHRPPARSASRPRPRQLRPIHAGAALRRGPCVPFNRHESRPTHAS